MIELVKQKKYYLQKLEQADQYLLSGGIQETIEILKTVIRQQHPEDPQQIFGLGSIADQKGYYEGRVFQWYQNEIKKGRIKKSSYDYLSLIFSINRKYGQAQKYYQQMLQKYPKNSNLRFGLANVYHNKGFNCKAKQEYLTIINQNPNFFHAYHQLAVISFSQDNYQKTKMYLSKLNAIEQGNLTILFLNAIIQQNKQLRIERMQRIIKDNKDFLRAYLMMGVILQQYGLYLQAIQWYKRCLEHDRNYKAPFIQLIHLYDNKLQYAQSLQWSLQLLKIYQIDPIVNLYVGIQYLNNKQIPLAEAAFRQSNKIIDCRLIYLNNLNRHYLHEWVNKMLQIISLLKSKNDLQKYKNSIDEIKIFVFSLQTYKQQKINVTLERHRHNNPNLARLINMIVEDNFELKNKQLFHEIFKMYRENDMYLQLISIVYANYILKKLRGKQIELVSIQSQLSQLIIKQLQFKIEQKEDEDQNEDSLQLRKHSYVIKHTARELNLLQNHQNLNSYRHLYHVIKKIVKKSRKIIPQLQDLMSILKKEANALNSKIISRLSSQNQSVVINQIIQHILPEIKNKNRQIMSKIQRQINQLQTQELSTFIKSMKVIWQEQVQAIIEQKNLNKVPIIWNNQDLVTAQCVFSSQVKTISAMKRLQSYCNQHEYEIVDIDGRLDDREEQALLIRIRIKDTGCIIRLAVNRQVKYKRFKSYAKQFQNYPMGTIFNTFLKITKHEQFSFLDYCKDCIQHLSNSEDPKKVNLGSSINQIIKDLELNVNFQPLKDNQKLQRTNRIKDQHNELELLKVIKTPQDNSILQEQLNLKQKAQASRCFLRNANIKTDRIWKDRQIQSQKRQNKQYSRAQFSRKYSERVKDYQYQELFKVNAFDHQNISKQHQHLKNLSYNFEDEGKIIILMNNQPYSNDKQHKIQTSIRDSAYQFEALQSRIKQLQQNVSVMAIEKDQIIEECHKKQEKISTLKKSVQLLNSTSQILNQKLRQSQKRCKILKQYQAKQKQWQKIQASLSLQISIMKNKMGQKQTQLQQIKNQRKQAKQQANQLKQKYQQQKNTLVVQTQALNTRINQSQQLWKQQRQKLQTIIQQKNQQINNLNDKIAQDEQKFKRMTLDQTKSNQKISTLLDDIQTLKTQIQIFTQNTELMAEKQQKYQRNSQLLEQYQIKQRQWKKQKSQFQLQINKAHDQIIFKNNQNQLLKSKIYLVQQQSKRQRQKNIQEKNTFLQSISRLQNQIAIYKNSSFSTLCTNTTTQILNQSHTNTSNLIVGDLQDSIIQDNKQRLQKKTPQIQYYKKQILQTNKKENKNNQMRSQQTEIKKESKSFEQYKNIYKNKLKHLQSSNKKIQYLKIIFAILFFEAATITFTIKLLQ